MRLYVEAAGRTVPLDVGRRTDAASVLRKLKRRRIRCDRLCVRGRPWDTQETTKELNLQPNDTIQALDRLKGGCLEHQLKLYMRCVHLFKVLIAFYMFCMGAESASFLTFSEVELRVDGVFVVSRHRDAVFMIIRASRGSFVTVLAQARAFCRTSPSTERTGRYIFFTG